MVKKSNMEIDALIKNITKDMGVLVKEVRRMENVTGIFSVKPKFHPNQMVWKFKEHTPSWYKYPVQMDLNNAFEEIEIDQVVISRLEDSRTRDCSAGTEEERKQLVASYRFGLFGDGSLLERDIWTTKEEAVEKNRHVFLKEQKRYYKELEDKKKEQIAQKKREIKELENE